MMGIDDIGETQRGRGKSVLGFVVEDIPVHAPDLVTEIVKQLSLLMKVLVLRIVIVKTYSENERQRQGTHLWAHLAQLLLRTVCFRRNGLPPLLQVIQALLSRPHTLHLLSYRHFVRR